MFSLIKKGYYLISDLSSRPVCFSDFKVRRGVQKAREVADEIVSRMLSDHESGFQPVIFSGGFNSGKTLLMRAITGEVLKKIPDCPILSMGAEIFVHNIGQAIRYHDSVGFQALLKDSRMLVLDDLHLVTKLPYSWEWLVDILRSAEKNQQIVMGAFALPHGDELKIRRELPHLHWVVMHPPQIKRRIWF